MEKTYWLHAISPLHVGAGRGVGYIDLPLAREKGTNWPYVPGSAVKGVLRQKAVDICAANVDAVLTKADIDAAFGQRGDSDASAGSLVFSDASIVCLPVRSFYGTFAWITSPLALRRLRCLNEADIPSVIDIEVNDIFIPEGAVISQSADKNIKVYLEELDLQAQIKRELNPCRDFIAGKLFTAEGEKKIFKARFALVHDDIFTFLCETGTQVDARIRIDDEKKTAASGALWYEESLPIETILAGTVWCDTVFTQIASQQQTAEQKQQKQRELMNKFCNEALDLQIGGKATTGKGRVRCLFS
jgi:CRISPR-associated protein Cmr4